MHFLMFDGFLVYFSLLLALYASLFSLAMLVFILTLASKSGYFTNLKGTTPCGPSRLDTGVTTNNFAYVIMRSCSVKAEW